MSKARLLLYAYFDMRTCTSWLPLRAVQGAKMSSPSLTVQMDVYDGKQIKNSKRKIGGRSVLRANLGKKMMKQKWRAFRPTS